MSLTGACLALAFTNIEIVDWVELLLLFVCINLISRLTTQMVLGDGEKSCCVTLPSYVNSC